MHLYTKTFYSNLPVKSSLEAFMTEYALTKCRSWALQNESKKTNVFGLFSQKPVRIKKKVFNLTTEKSPENSDKNSKEVKGALIIHGRQRKYWFNMRVWKGESWSRIPALFSRESRIPHVFHQFPESRFSFPQKYIKSLISTKANKCKM